MTALMVTIISGQSKNFRVNKDPYTLFIDDEREQSAEHRFDVTVRSYEEAKALFEARGFPYMVSFDHDLGTEKTGYDIAKLMVEMELLGIRQFPQSFIAVVHSQNPIGKKNIEEYLRNYFEVRNEIDAADQPDEPPKEV